METMVMDVNSGSNVQLSMDGSWPPPSKSPNNGMHNDEGSISSLGQLAEKMDQQQELFSVGKEPQQGSIVSEGSASASSVDPKPKDVVCKTQTAESISPMASFESKRNMFKQLSSRQMGAMNGSLSSLGYTPPEGRSPKLTQTRRTSVELMKDQQMMLEASLNGSWSSVVSKRDLYEVDSKQNLFRQNSNRQIIADAAALSPYASSSQQVESPVVPARNVITPGSSAGRRISSLEITWPPKKTDLTPTRDQMPLYSPLTTPINSSTGKPFRSASVEGKRVWPPRLPVTGEDETPNNNNSMSQSLHHTPQYPTRSNSATNRGATTKNGIACPHTTGSAKELYTKNKLPDNLLAPPLYKPSQQQRRMSTTPRWKPNHSADSSALYSPRPSSLFVQWPPPPKETSQSKKDESVATTVSSPNSSLLSPSSIPRVRKVIAPSLKDRWPPVSAKRTESQKPKILAEEIVPLTALKKRKTVFESPRAKLIFTSEQEELLDLSDSTDLDFKEEGNDSVVSDAANQVSTDATAASPLPSNSGDDYANNIDDTYDNTRQVYQPPSTSRSRSSRSIIKPSEVDVTSNDKKEEKNNDYHDSSIDDNNDENGNTNGNNDCENEVAEYRQDEAAEEAEALEFTLPSGQKLSRRNNNPKKRQKKRRRRNYRIRYDGPSLLPIEEIYEKYPDFDSRFESHKDGSVPMLPGRRRSSSGNRRRGRRTSAESRDTLPSRPGRRTSDNYDNDFALSPPGRRPYDSDYESEGGDEGDQEEYELDGINEEAEEEKEQLDQQLPKQHPDVWITSIPGTETKNQEWKVKRVWHVEELDAKEPEYFVNTEELFVTVKALFGVPEEGSNRDDGIDDASKGKDFAPMKPNRHWHVSEVWDVNGEYEESESEFSGDDAEMSAAMDFVESNSKDPNEQLQQEINDNINNNEGSIVLHGSILSLGGDQPLPSILDDDGNEDDTTADEASINNNNNTSNNINEHTKETSIKLSGERIFSDLSDRDSAMKVPSRNISQRSIHLDEIVDPDATETTEPMEETDTTEFVEYTNHDSSGVVVVVTSEKPQNDVVETSSHIDENEASEGSLLPANDDGNGDDVNNVTKQATEESNGSTKKKTKSSKTKKPKKQGSGGSSSSTTSSKQSEKNTKKSSSMSSNDSSSSSLGKKEKANSRAGSLEEFKTGSTRGRIKVEPKQIGLSDSWSSPLSGTKGPKKKKAW